ncbi:MAG: TatD family hydrolase [Lachnospiraceae bacterium]|nr:TatD family hydrolase [Lachnospiraceae bacterium]
MIFDTHAHYDDAAFDDDREELLSQFKAAGVRHFVNIGNDLASLDTTLELCKKYPESFAAFGIHPAEIAELTEKDIEGIKSKLENFDRAVAVGEIGLDYWEEGPDKELQKKWFIRQLELARELKLPVVIHSRDAAEDTYNILEEQHAEEIGGVIHCFSYSPEMAQRYVKMGFYIGIGGVVTFKNAKKAVEVVKTIPLERIVLETDSPYLAPTPYRGKRNSSINLTLVAEKIAEIKGITAEEVYDRTYRNALDLYRIKE